MSGGSFNYLHRAYGTDLLWRVDDLRAMADDLAAEFPGSAAAIHTTALIEDIEQLAEAAEVASVELADVWHAQEWWRSADFGRHQVVERITAYEQAHAGGRKHAKTPRHAKEVEQ